LIIGNPKIFAVESHADEWHERLSFRAWGWFVFHLGGERYGRVMPWGTALGCSYDAVVERCDRRGAHVSPLGDGFAAIQIATMVERTIYDTDREGIRLGDFDEHAISEAVYGRKLLMAPDGDAAFDDGSRVLHFDLGSKVRLIAWTGSRELPYYRAMRLTEVFIYADEFYSVLQSWHEAFLREWTIMPKIAE